MALKATEEDAHMTEGSLSTVWALAAIAWGAVFVAAAERTKDTDGPALLGSRGALSRSVGTTGTTT